jgi:RimJ/RimL family protein N-acetyltransferase
LKCGQKKVGWISILIGDKTYWGKGLSKILMHELEMSAKELGCDCIELGVFEYNDKAIKLYENMGYDRCCRVDKFVYHQGQWYDDIRMLKSLL